MKHSPVLRSLRLPERRLAGALPIGIIGPRSPGRQPCMTSGCCGRHLTWLSSVVLLKRDVRRWEETACKSIFQTATNSSVF